MFSQKSFIVDVLLGSKYASGRWVKVTQTNKCFFPLFESAFIDTRKSKLGK